MDIDAGDPLPLATATVDWADLSVPTACGSFPVNKYDRLMVARFEAADLSTLEEHFLELESKADQVWTADIDAYSRYDLRELRTEDGEAFESFDVDNTWILALSCTTCNNPAPPFLALIGDE